MLLTAAALAWGALAIPASAGYGGVGPNFLPWLVSGVLGLCGVFLVGNRFRAASANSMPAAARAGPTRAPSPGCRPAVAECGADHHAGFIVSCTLCYLLAVQGLRRAAGQPAAGSLRTWGQDLVTGLLISAPVFWAFTQFLAINLPGLTTRGWL